jgi:hypothetical protein
MNMIITRNLMKYFLDVIIFFGCPNRQVNDSEKRREIIFTTIPMNTYKQNIVKLN